MTQVTKKLVLLMSASMLASACSIQPGNKYTYGYYSGRERPASAQTDNYASKSALTHIVNKGETLYSIAWEYGQDVRDVAHWNNIRAPYTIYPQQVLRVVPPAQKTAGKTAPARHSPAAAVHTPRHAAAKTAKPVTNRTQKISWQWPTNGTIINRFSARDSGKKGLGIAGKTGQAIKAAADGSVVYAGDALRGYGQLVIIKHDETYFSAYAHNNRLHVREEQAVKKGQHIADMGNSGTDRVMLHFEVRRDGKPVDPLQYLPRR